MYVFSCFSRLHVTMTHSEWSPLDVQIWGAALRLFAPFIVWIFLASNQSIWTFCPRFSFYLRDQSVYLCLWSRFNQIFFRLQNFECHLHGQLCRALPSSSSIIVHVWPLYDELRNWKLQSFGPEAVNCYQFFLSRLFSGDQVAFKVVFNEVLLVRSSEQWPWSGDQMPQEYLNTMIDTLQWFSWLTAFLHQLKDAI